MLSKEERAAIEEWLEARLVEDGDRFAPIGEDMARKLLAALADAERERDEAQAKMAAAESAARDVYRRGYWDHGDGAGYDAHGAMIDYRAALKSRS